MPLGGTLTGEHGIGKIKTPYLELEHGSDVVNLMSQIKEFFDPNRILNPGIGKGEIHSIEKPSFQRKLKNQSNKILELECMRCGFCIVSCHSKIHYMLESYSPRGRLSLLNGIVHGDLKLTNSIRDLIQACTLCGLCHIKCPAGIDTVEIFEKVREIMHKKK